ncbi:MAG: bifunctional (p)ppGpp synthetase/guanosine-3',5'-bis(diphosphate) 3'-pyrophosphohydrolase [Clostridiales Family XIII bacterium]|jgi:GTP pyrophosphokinase|nr:bifunctional (p)ppGpp synthetase/guanosine-3',5'-bis(diphosphate) 3'-pyrophosphohydrolase [Clostridiales Family XIII bacterium]
MAGERFEQYIEDILNINPGVDIGLLERAYDIAEKYHKGQKRMSGEEYITHPMEVTKILADLGMDGNTLAAGLLHDTVEDTPYTIEEVRSDFGEEVAFLVDGVTKLGNIAFDTKEEKQAENLRKMLFAIAEDVRVLIIKLADRLHNFRTIDYMTHDQIVAKCQETLDIYAPLASRLGIYTIKSELEDIALKHLYPEVYAMLKEQVSEKKVDREEKIAKVMEELHHELEENGIDYELKGRSKHFYSIYRKMVDQHRSLDEIYDLIAVRVIVGTNRECYDVLGIVHSLWRQMPRRFADYISMPKPNLYQSIHTTCVGDDGEPFEVQIRTREMHRVAEYGIAAHWKYKEGISEAQEEMKLAWIRQSLESTKEETNDPAEYMEALKMDLFSNQVFVFTPNGDVMELPAGSTPLDFAFKVHTDVGVKCVGAKVNKKMVPIDYKLQNGEFVDIVTSNTSKGPSMDWLNIAKSSHARTKIRQWLKKQDKPQSVDKGRELLERAAKRKGYESSDLLRAAWMGTVGKSMGYDSLTELYTSLSYGGTTVNKVLNRLVGIHNEERAKKEKQSEPDFEEIVEKHKVKNQVPANHSRIKVEGMDGMLVRLSRCCSPVPGDPIIGYITKGRGVSVHVVSCPNIINLSDMEKGRLIGVEWDSAVSDGGYYNADILIQADDRKGLFADISRACADMDVNIAGVSLRTNKDNTVDILMTLTIASVNQMERILNKIRSVENVTDVHRARA